MVQIYVHGTTSPNPGKGVYSFLVYDNYKKIKDEKGIVSQYTTPSIAEYEAIIKALEAAKELGIKTVEVLSSNKLVVNQLKQINTPDQLKPYYKKVVKFEKDFDKVGFTYLDKTKNKAIKLTQSLLNPRTSRRDKAKELVSNTFVKIQNGYLYIKEDGYYYINLQVPSCTCYDNQINRYLCKHIIAAQMLEEKLEKLLH